MTSRERINRMLNHRIADRIPIQDSPWGSTTRQWEKEGLPEGTTPAEHFGFEMEHYGADLSPRFPVRTIEKTAEFIIQTTATGGKRKNFLDYSTTPEVIDWPIRTRDDWKEIKKRLKPDFTRVDWSTGLAHNGRTFEEGKYLCYSGAYGFDALQTYMKTEQLLILMAEDPDWIKEMIMTLAESNIIMTELMIQNGFKFDGAFMYNDMGYKNGLFFSPNMYMKTHYEADRMVNHYFHTKGMKVFLHSCGNVKELIPILIETGLDCLQPLEVKAGMDLVELKEKFGDRLTFMGGIDVRLMTDPDPSKIEEEIKVKITAAKKNGGYIYHSDHSIPKNVGFERFSHIMELVKQYGAYEEFVETAEPEQPPAPVPQTAVAPKPAKKPLFSFGAKKTPGKAAAPATEPTATPAPETAVPPEAAAKKPEPPAKEGGRKFSLPFFGKKEGEK